MWKMNACTKLCCSDMVSPQCEFACVFLDFLSHRMHVYTMARGTHTLYHLNASSNALPSVVVESKLSYILQKCICKVSLVYASLYDC